MPLRDFARAAVLAVMSLGAGCAVFAPPPVSPLVATMPPAAEDSIATVGAYVRAREPDPVRRIKALHDYVATRIAYDRAGVRGGVVPREDWDPEAVFRSHRAIGWGYARLLSALGAAAGTPIEVVAGTDGNEWNRVMLGGRPLYIDVMWDAGIFMRGGSFRKRYSTEYFLRESYDFDNHVAAFVPYPPPPTADATSCRLARTLEADARWSAECSAGWDGSVR